MSILYSLSRSKISVRINLISFTNMFTCVSVFRSVRIASRSCWAVILISNNLYLPQQSLSVKPSQALAVFLKWINLSNLRKDSCLSKSSVKNCLETIALTVSLSSLFDIFFFGERMLSLSLRRHRFWLVSYECSLVNFFLAVVKKQKLNYK